MLTVSHGSKTAETRTLSLLILGDFLKGQWVCTRAFSYATAAQYCSGLSHPISGGCWFPFGNVQNVPCTHVYVLSLYCWLTVCRRFGARTVSKHIQAPIVMGPWAGPGPSGSAARKITNIIRGFWRGEVVQQKMTVIRVDLAFCNGVGGKLYFGSGKKKKTNKTEHLGKSVHLQMKPNSLVPAFPDRNCPCRHEHGRRRVLHDLSCWGSEGGREGGTEGPRMPGRGTIGQGGKKSD